MLSIVVDVVDFYFHCYSCCCQLLFSTYIILLLLLLLLQYFTSTCTLNVFFISLCIQFLPIFMHCITVVVVVGVVVTFHSLFHSVFLLFFFSIDSLTDDANVTFNDVVDCCCCCCCCCYYSTILNVLMCNRMHLFIYLIGHLSTSH